MPTLQPSPDASDRPGRRERQLAALIRAASLVDVDEVLDDAAWR